MLNSSNSKKVVILLIFKTPLKETRYLGNPYFFTDCVSIQFLIHLLFLTQLVRLSLVTYPSLCSTCVIYGTLATPLVTSYFLPKPVTVSATDLREGFLLSGVFYLALLPAVLKASLGAGSSTSRLAWLHADLQNIVPAQLIV